MVLAWIITMRSLLSMTFAAHPVSSSMVAANMIFCMVIPFCKRQSLSLKWLDKIWNDAPESTQIVAVIG
jgi:hypothetical protein